MSKKRKNCFFFFVLGWLIMSMIVWYYIILCFCVDSFLIIVFRDIIFSWHHLSVVFVCFFIIISWLFSCFNFIFFLFFGDKILYSVVKSCQNILLQFTMPEYLVATSDFDFEFVTLDRCVTFSFLDLVAIHCQSKSQVSF